MSDGVHIVHIVPFRSLANQSIKIEWVVPLTYNAFTFVFLRTALVESGTHQLVNHSISCVFVLKNKN